MEEEEANGGNPSKENNIGSVSTAKTVGGGGGGGDGGSLKATAAATPPPAKKTPNDFIFGKLLGEGSFSSVYLAKDVKTGKEYAIKVCDKQHIIRERKAESIRREKEVLTILSANRNPSAPFFVHLYATFQDAHRLYFVVTFAHGGELLKYLHKVGSFPLPCCQFYAAEILQALRHLHAIGIVHRDLKPENILLNEHGHILITDYGSAKIIRSEGGDDQVTSSPSFRPPQTTTSTNSNSSEQASSPVPGGGGDGGGGRGRNARSNSFVGTAQYVSPEVLKGRYSEVGPPADLWAFGCIVFQLVAGLLPFQATNEFLIFQKILKLEYEFPPDFPPVAKDLVDRLLQLEPEDRLGAQDKQRYQSIQRHPFFNGVQFEALSSQVPPVILSAGGAKKPRRPTIPENYSPGFDPRVIAERVLKSEQDSIENDSDEDEEEHGLHQQVTQEAPEKMSTDLAKLSVAGDISSSSSSSPHKRSSLQSGKSVHTAVNSRSVQLPRDDTERKLRLEEQLRQNPQSHAAVKGNLILKQGLVNKRKGLFARKRLLFLTEGPHLFYCDPGSLHVKGEIPWGAQLKPEAKDFKYFFVHTPNRTYNLEDPEGYALEWCRAINEIHQQVFGQTATSVVSGADFKQP